MNKYKLVTLLLVILGLSILVIICKPYKNTDEYLKRNYSDLNLEDENNFLGFEILADDIKDKKIFFTGEFHNLDMNDKLQLKFLTYLQKEANVNYILDEVGYADSYFLNKYLESGNESILKNYFSIYTGQKFNTEERYNYYVSIYKLNQTLSKERQIKVIGVDIESQATYDYLIDIIKENSTITSELEKLIDELKEFNYRSKDNYRNIIDILDTVNKDINVNEKEYRNILKEDTEFESFKLTIKNLMNFSRLQLGDKSTYNNLRDNYIYENFKLIDSKLTDAIYFGQWGSFHTLQDTIYHGDFSNDIDFFASLLNKDPQYTDKILSLEYAYYSNDNADLGGYCYINEDLFKYFLKSNSRVSIFKLNNRKSPFKKDYINTFNSNVIDYKNNPITDYFQYLVLIRDSKQSVFVFE